MIIAIIVNKSPASLFAGLGASAAILMLVFKDSILGFVAGIQLSANDMVRPGDWITLPSGAANGTVQEITLNTVKIQNFDNTILQFLLIHWSAALPELAWNEGVRRTAGDEEYHTGFNYPPVLYAGNARPLSERDSLMADYQRRKGWCLPIAGLSGVYRAVSL